MQESIQTEAAPRKTHKKHKDHVFADIVLRPVTALDRAVVALLKSNTEPEEKTLPLRRKCNEIITHGCAAATIGELTYTVDTVRFFLKHKEDINALLSEHMSNAGVSSIGDVLKGWDDTDPLALESGNQNALAWFAFEITTSDLLAAAESEE